MTRKEKKLALISAFLFVIMLSIIDLVLGYFLIPQSFNEFRVRNPIYHHGLEKNVSSRAAWGPILYPFYTNNLSFRDFSVQDVPLKSDKKRILILGDSHSEGVGIEYKFTFSGRLQQLANNTNMEILNASAVSYSPRIHYLKADYLLNHLELDVDEIWAVIDISDMQNEIAYASFAPDKPDIHDKILYNLQHFLKNNSFTWSTISRTLSQKETDEFNKALMGFKDQTSRLPASTSVELYKEFFRSLDNKELIQDPNFHGVGEWIYDSSLRELADQGLNLGMDNISALKKMCSEKNIKLRLSVHPWQTQVLKGDTSDYYVDRWRAYCREQNIDFMNLYPLFITGENPLLVTHTCYIEGDNHWNEIGHARVAEFMSNFLYQNENSN